MPTKKEVTKMDLNLGNVSPSVLQSFKQLYGGMSAFSAGRTRVGAGRDALKRWKMTSKSCSMQVVPVMLHIPFNPETGDPLATALPIPLSVRGGIQYLKYFASKNPRVLEALATSLDVKPDQINLSSLDVTDEDVKMFKPLRNILVYGATVMSVRPADSKYPYGTPYRMNIAYDEETNRYVDHPDNPLAYTLQQMESALCAIQIKNARDANDAAGVNRRTEKEMDDFTKRVWQERCFSNPYFLGTTRILDFPTDRNFTVTENVRNSWNKSVDDLRKQEVYIKVNKSIRETLEGILNGKYDRYEDFLLVRITVPEFTDETKATAAQQINRSAASSEDAIEGQLSDFINVYRQFRDNSDLWSEKVIRQIYEYRTLSDDQALSYFRSIMPGLKEYMKNPDIIKRYADVIAMVDSSLSEELMTAALMGETGKAVDFSAELKAAPVIDENTPGYGGDSMDAVPTGLGITEDDKKALEEAMDPVSAMTAALGTNA